MALNETLNTTGDPITRAMRSVMGQQPVLNETPEQGMQRRISRGITAEEQLPSLMEAQRAESQKAQEEIAAQRMGAAKRREEIGKEFATQERMLVESPEYRQKEIPAFEPSPTNLEDIRNVLALTTVAGFLVGGASKRSGLAAMAALNGGLEGFRQGRQEVYKRELDVFNKNIESIKENNRQTLDRFNKAMSLLQTDRKAAEGELKVLEAELENSTASAALRQGQYKQAQEILLKSVEGSDRASQLLLQMKQQADLARERMQEARARKQEFKVIGVDEAGNVVQVNDLGQTRTITGVKPATAGAGKVGQNNLMFAGRVHSNILGASKDLAGIASLPGASQSPVLSGVINRDPETVVGSLTAAAARKMTAQDQRAFDQVANSLDLALTKIEGQGLASSATKFNVQQYSALRPRAGDRAINMAIYLAKVRQEIETGVLSHSRMAGATAEQKQDLQNVLKDVEKTIPFTLDDVTDVLRKGRERLDEKTQRILGLPSVTEEAIRAGSGNLNADMPAITGQRPASNKPASGSQGASNAPDIDTWVAAAKVRNPNATDAELRAYWQNKYGASR